MSSARLVLAVIATLPVMSARHLGVLRTHSGVPVQPATIQSSGHRIFVTFIRMRCGRPLPTCWLRCERVSGVGFACSNAPFTVN